MSPTVASHSISPESMLASQSQLESYLHFGDRIFYKIHQDLKVVCCIFKLYCGATGNSHCNKQIHPTWTKINLSLYLLHVPSNCFFLHHWWYIDAVGEKQRDSSQSHRRKEVDSQN